jgi:hypothetical protein
MMTAHRRLSPLAGATCIDVRPLNVTFSVRPFGESAASAERTQSRIDGVLAGVAVRLLLLVERHGEREPLGHDEARLLLQNQRIADDLWQARSRGRF